MAVHREPGVEDWLAILRRRFWWLLIPGMLCAIAGFALSLVVPKEYTSHTRVLVEAPIVPDSYVRPVVSDDLNRRLASMQGEILSRTRLEHLVVQFGLYKDSNQVPMEALVSRLQKSIKVTPLSPTPGTLSLALLGFNIDVTLGQASLAQRVCSEVTSLFMEQNLRLREQQAEDTTQFLGKQLDEAKAKLDEQDAKLAKFQGQYLGAQPEDEQTNLTLLSGLTSQLQAATQDLNQAEQNKAFIESMLNQQLAAWKSSSEGRNPQTLQQRLTELENQLPALQARYTEKHPAVLKLKDEIAEIQQKMLEASRQERDQATDQQSTLLAVEPQQIQQLRAELHQAELTMSQKKADQQQLQPQIKALQSRIQLSPMVQQEFKALTRDYQTALTFYNDLLKKRDEAQMATELEHRQQGEQFRVLDPPTLPERPSFPNRRTFSLGGLGAGLTLGLGMVLLAECYDKSIRTSEDVLSHLGVFTLAVIPSIAPATGKSRTVRNLAAARRKLALRAASGE